MYGNTAIQLLSKGVIAKGFSTDIMPDTTYIMFKVLDYDEPFKW